jgi:hypothetical protein
VALARDERAGRDRVIPVLAPDPWFAAVLKSHARGPNGKLDGSRLEPRREAAFAVCRLGNEIRENLSAWIERGVAISDLMVFIAREAVFICTRERARRETHEGFCRTFVVSDKEWFATICRPVEAGKLRIVVAVDGSVETFTVPVPVADCRRRWRLS